MPQTLGFLLFTLGAPLGAVNFVTFGAGASIVSALLSVGASVGLSYLANKLLQPAVPKATDGKYNLRQNVPSRVRVYGRVKKGGDYVFLEESDGAAHHIIVWASHRIQSFDQHWLHDEPTALDGSGDVTVPTHFRSKVNILSRLGLSPETAYAGVVAAFPTIWTSAHRGDGLASVRMVVKSVAQEDFQTVFPQGMPSHTAVGRGALVWDPRTDLTAYSENLALIRLDHLMHESGLRRSVDEIDLASFIAAADICGEAVLNADGDPEPRYAGGGWYRYENRPADVGKIIDQAGDFMLYETAAGTIGIHAGAWVEPDITLDELSIQEFSLDVNARQSTTCVAVRGRYTSIAHDYNTVDATVYGDPYAADDERTLTLDLSWVQRHNHCQRLQKLAYIRANAPRVAITAHYEAAQDISTRRFVRINAPPRLDNVIVELAGRPTISLANLTVTFEGIIVSAGLYDFNAALEEGTGVIVPDAPPPTPLEPPTGIGVEIITETVGGVAVDYAHIFWDAGPDTLTYDVEYGRTSETATAFLNVMPAGTEEATTPPLADIETYHFRVRSVSGGGAHSEWSVWVMVSVGISDLFLLVDATDGLLVEPGVPLHL